MLLHTLADNFIEAKNKLNRNNMTLDQVEAYDFFSNHTGRIEVFIDDEIFRVYFPILPVCKFLSH
jgi:hypothetical protein